MQSQNMFQNRGNDELETLYPETYKIVYPMVKKVCMQNTKPITQELVDNMTNEIYTNIEASGDIINVNIDVGDNRETKTDMEVKAKNNRGTDNRQFNGPMNDLIKILILRELLGRPGGWRPGPPPPPRPPRPGVGWR